MSVVPKEATPVPTVPLAEVAYLVRGVSYPKTDAREEASPGYVPVLRATNIQDARLILDANLVFIAERNVSQEQRLRPGDIVVATSSGSKHLVGKSAQCSGNWDGSFGAFCAAVRPKSNIEPRYLAHFLQSPFYWKQVTKKAVGVNINNLRRGDLETLMLPLPPLGRQRDIVAEIEKQFSRLDEAVTTLKRIKANLTAYRAAVLGAAVEGRLVQSLKPWPVKRLGDVAKTSSGGTPKRSNQSYFGGGIPWVKSGELDGSEVTATSESLTKAGLQSSAAKIFPKGTLCIALYGATVGKLGILGIEAATNQAVCGIFLPPEMDTRFVFFCLQSMRNAIIKLGKGGAQPNISQELVRDIRIPVPELDEQHQVVTEIESRLSVTRNIEIAVGATLKRAEGLRQAQLTCAFSLR